MGTLSKQELTFHNPGWISLLGRSTPRLFGVYYTYLYHCQHHHPHRQHHHPHRQHHHLHHHPILLILESRWALGWAWRLRQAWECRWRFRSSCYWCCSCCYYCCCWSLQWWLELITFEILPAARLRLMSFNSRLIIHYLKHFVSILDWKFSTNDRSRNEEYEFTIWKIYFQQFQKYCLR